MPDPARDQDAALLLQVIVDAPVPLWLIDGAGRVSIANREAMRFLGFRDGTDLVGGPSHELLHRFRCDGTPYPEHECPIIGSAEPAPSPEVFFTRSGDARPVHWSTRRIGNAGSTLLSFTSAGSDRDRAVGKAWSAGHTLDPSGAGHGGNVGGAVKAAGARPEEARVVVRENLFRSIDLHFRDPTFSAIDLAAQAHLSVRAVQLLFADVGSSPAAELRRRRLDHAKTLLEQGHTVGSACHASGFQDAGTFARAYRRYFGLPPSRTRLLPPG